jgi:hypothetical protein
VVNYKPPRQEVHGDARLRGKGGAGMAFEEGLDFFEFCEGGAGAETGEAAAVFEEGFFF